MFVGEGDLRGAVRSMSRSIFVVRRIGAKVRPRGGDKEVRVT
jgi:hypothetical protein